jgi:pyruvate/2-oxoglutarate dehydrogenase complex dihydrolipoamide dehydrogenase (E3) component
MRRPPNRFPKHWVILGGGAVSLEIAQAFGRFGSRVTVVEAASHLVPDEEPEVARLVADRLRAEQVQLELGTSAKRFDWSSAKYASSSKMGDP